MKKGLLTRVALAATVFAFLISLTLAVSLVADKFSSRGVDALADGTAIWDGTIAGSFAGGAGTEINPYQISNGAELAYLAKVINENTNSTLYNSVNVYYKLINEIYLNYTTDWENWENENPDVTLLKKWTPIGDYYNDIGFKANFDGDGYAIKGIYINTTNYGRGLFGYVYGGTIQNTGVEQGYIKGDVGVGGIAGFVGIYSGGGDSSITNCYNTNVVIGNINVGGVAGYFNDAIITDCYNTGEITGKTQVGGVTGRVFGGSITNSYNYGVVTGADFVSSAGGVTGGVSDGGSVMGCYNTGDVFGTGDYAFFVGGVAGFLGGGNVANCFNIGTVTGTGDSIDGYAGGVAGCVSENSSVVNCYNSGGVICSVNAGGVVGYVDSFGGVINCYNNGAVTGGLISIAGWYVGGVAGYIYYGGYITNCYNSGIVKGNSMNAGGVAGAANSNAEYCYYLTGTAVSGIGVGNGMSIVEFNSNGNLNVVINGMQYNNLLSALNGWIKNPLQSPPLGITYNQWYNEIYPAFTQAQVYTYIVTFNLNGGSGVESSLTMEEGNTINLGEYIPIRDGYVFEGWYLDGAFTQKTDDVITVTGDMQLYALWAKDNTGENNTGKSDDTGGCGAVSFGGNNALTGGLVVLLVGVALFAVKRKKRANF